MGLLNRGAQRSFQVASVKSVDYNFAVVPMRNLYHSYILHNSPFLKGLNIMISIPNGLIFKKKILIKSQLKKILRI